MSARGTEEWDEDLRREAIDERRSRNRSSRCLCSDLDMPGRCPGPDQCPLVNEGDDE